MEPIEAKIIYATIRDGGYDEEWDANELHIECRFENGEKYAAVIVDGTKPELAMKICNFINLTSPVHNAEAPSKLEGPVLGF